MLAKINPTTLPKEKLLGINPSNISKERVQFNFKYLNCRHKKFVFSGQQKQYFIKLLERLPLISERPIQELVTSSSDSLRFHSIDFLDKNVSEKSFSLAPKHINDIASENACQFSISQTISWQKITISSSPLYLY